MVALTSCQSVWERSALTIDQPMEHILSEVKYLGFRVEKQPIFEIFRAPWRALTGGGPVWLYRLPTGVPESVPH